MFVPLSTSVPAPAFVRPSTPAMTELIVVVLAVKTLIEGVVPASVNVLPVNVIPV